LVKVYRCSIREETQGSGTRHGADENAGYRVYLLEKQNAAWKGAGRERRTPSLALFEGGGRSRPMWPLRGRLEVTRAGDVLPPHPGAGVSFFVGPLSSSEREDRVLDVPDVLHHGYPEVVTLPATGGEPEVDDHEPGEREEHEHRDGVGKEAWGGPAGEDE